MPSDMRRPATIDIDEFVMAMDARLRDEVGRTRRWMLPEAVKHPIKALKAAGKPVLQSGAMVLTALSVIIAVGVAPATLSTSQPENAPLAAPTITESVVSFTDRLPVDDLLAVQKADNLDTPLPAPE